jgi:hypothetical protein
VSTDHDEITADLEEEKLLAQLKNVTLENVGKGKLSLTSKQIEFEKKGGLFSSPRLEFSVDLSRVSSAEADDSSNSLVLEWLDENSERGVSQLILPGGDAATNLCQSLYNILKLVRRLVHTLAETVASRDGPSVLRNVTATLKAIGTSLHNELPIAEEWKELSQEDSPGLNWRDIRYIFLFAGRYKLLSLWQRLHENKKIDDSLPRLARFSSILADKIPMEFQPGRSSEEEDTPSTISSVEAAAQSLENSLKMNAGIA